MKLNRNIIEVSRIIKSSLILFLFASYLFSDETDSLGTDNKPILNSFEYDYINNLLVSRKLVDDSLERNCKYIFITGLSGGERICKKIFFKDYVNPWIKKYQQKPHQPMPQIWVKYLSKEEKDISGGYDAIMCIWVKRLSDKTRKKIIKQIGKER